jgi:hypothetical protein
MHIITGDETGFLKLVNVTNRNYIKYGNYQSRDYGISDVMYIKEKKMILSLKINSTIDMYSINQSINNDVDVDCDERVDITSSSSIFINNYNNLIYRKCIDNIIIEKPKAFQNIISNNKRSNVIVVYNTIGEIATYRINGNNNNTNYDNNDAYCIDNISNFNISNNIEVSDTCHSGEMLFGGKENDAKIYNIETQQMIWNALNVSQDKLHLRVPVWITAIAFQQPYINNNIFYTGTAYKHIRMYDTKSSQRPVVSIDIGGDYRISSICPSINSSIKDDNDTDSSRYLYVADTSGGLSLWDMRQQRRLHVMKSAAGSIRRMVTSDNGEYLACVGLDRFLRVYDTTTNAITDAVYLKNRLNCCIFAEIGSGDSSRGGVVKSKRTKCRRMAVHNEEDDDLLEVVGDNDDDDDDDDDDDENDDDDDDDENDDDDDEEDDDNDNDNEEDDDDEEDDDGQDEDENEEQDDSEDEVSEDKDDRHQPPLLKKLTLKPQTKRQKLHSRNINPGISNNKKRRHASIHG